MKKKLLLAFSFWLLAVVPAFSQQYYARRIWPMAALPATCTPANGEVVYLNAGVTGVYFCSAANTWTRIGATAGGIFLAGDGAAGAPAYAFATTPTLGFYRVNATTIGLGTGNALQWAQAAIVTSQPFITHTATWNAGAITFDNIFSNITDTASAAGSFLIRLQVGGATQFSVTKAGALTTTGQAVFGAHIWSSGAAGSFIGFTARSTLQSLADGRWKMANQADTAFTRLAFGPEGAAYPGITVSAPVGGFTQGIILTKSDGNTSLFADLGAATNGSMTYCSDCGWVNIGACTAAALGNCVCAAGGTGAVAHRLNGAWYCAVL